MLLASHQATNLYLVFVLRNQVSVPISGYLADSQPWVGRWINPNVILETKVVGLKWMDRQMNQGGAQIKVNR